MRLSLIEHGSPEKVFRKNFRSEGKEGDKGTEGVRQGDTRSYFIIVLQKISRRAGHKLTHTHTHIHTTDVIFAIADLSLLLKESISAQEQNRTATCCSSR